MNGYRTSMEDAHLVLLQEGWAVCGIFDGHGGDICSKVIAKGMSEYLINLSQSIDIAKGELKYDHIMNMCYVLDQECSGEDFNTCGTTAVFCIIHSMNIHGAMVTICNIGDSRLSICRPNIGTIYTTIDHKPTHPLEEARITAASGWVVQGRVNGQLALSRAFGDFAYKKQNVGMDELFRQAVIAKPDITNIHMKPGDYILLYCDGIYEAPFTPQEVATMADDNLRLTKPTEICGMLIHEALSRGSKDNVSAMTVRLTTPDEKEEKPEVPTHNRIYEAGSVYGMGNDKFRRVYEGMAERAGSNFQAAIIQRLKFLKKEHTEEVNSESLIDPPIKNINNILRNNGLVSCGNALLDRTIISQGEFLRFTSPDVDICSKCFYYKTPLATEGRPTWSNGHKGSACRCIFYADDRWIVATTIQGKPLLTSSCSHKLPYGNFVWRSVTDLPIPPLKLELATIQMDCNTFSDTVRMEIEETEKYLTYSL